MESRKHANSLFKLKLYKILLFQFAKELGVSCSVSCHGFGALKAPPDEVPPSAMVAAEFHLLVVKV